jgi:hypothetical protein
VYRDIRYGLTRGLARRAKPDGIPLLIEMATRDPLTLIRQQARYAIADIQDACRLRGENVPVVTLPEPRPMEELYPPRAKVTWSISREEADKAMLQRRLVAEMEPRLMDTQKPAVSDYLVKQNFRDLNMAQASGAKHMMVDGITQLRTVMDLRRNRLDRRLLTSLLEHQSPSVQFLAMERLTQNEHKEAIPDLLAKLDPFAKSANTVGFWWCCEALAKLKAKDAVPVLAKHATPTNPPNTHGPPGMATGYIASKALAQIVADPKHTDVERLLKSDNVWLRAGALRGLAEAGAAGIEPLLREAAGARHPAVVRQEARVQLARRGGAP